MPDDLKNPGPEDGKLISLTQEHELDGWCRTFSCTRDELREAVKLMGNSAKAVRQYFADKTAND